MRAVRLAETPLGTVVVEASETGVVRVRLPGERGEERAGAGGEIAASAAEQISEYASGNRETFDVPLDWSGVDETHRRVLETLRAFVPYGATVTYGELGARAAIEDPRNVGVLMARNPLPLVVPCHRVVASDGLGGYGGGLELKRRLLELEGAMPPRLDLGDV